ncbi:hypothetical protein ACN28S_27120 [Cystobacter fuscus]
MRYFDTVSSRLLGLFSALTLLACGGPVGEESAVDAASPSSTAKALDTGETPPLEVAPASKEKEAIDLRGPNPGGDRPSMAAFSYSTSFTNSATTNTADIYFNLSAGQTIVVGTCGVNGASGSGDTYLRFYNPSGVQVAGNDDACGSLSNFTYVVPATGTYRLSAGCFGNLACSGTVGYSLAGVFGTYSTSATNSATINTADVYISLAAGQIITLGTCGLSGASGSGDTYLRFYNPSGVQVANNDDACGSLSNFTYTVPATGTYRLSAGCFSSLACSGTLAYLVQ